MTSSSSVKGRKVAALSAKRQTTEWLDEPRRKIRRYTPHKFEHLIKLFDGLNVAVRLLKLRKIDLFFSNISRSVEAIAGRRFTFNHLAQMKYLLPECILITRTNVLNERTLCRNPDLCVNLNPDAIPSSKHMDAVTKLKSIFRSKLADFFESHPEIDDVPEAMLPQPFKKKQASPKLHSLELEKAEVATPIKEKLHEEQNSFTPMKDALSSSSFSNLPREKSVSTDEPPRKLRKHVSRSLFSKATDPIFSNEFIESVSGKERKIEEEENEREGSRRRTMLFRLPDLFDKVHFLYHSMNKSVISKEELLHKLMFRDLGLIDRGELEEQLKLMMELIPHYISEKILLSGDRMIRVDKISSSTYAREQLEAAKLENC